MSWLDSLGNAFAGYPRWFVLACATVGLVAILWVLAKVLKWSLYVLAFLVVLAGAGILLTWILT